METIEAVQIAKKLLIKTAQRWAIIHSPDTLVKSFTSLNVEIETLASAGQNLDGVLVFVKNSTDLKETLLEIVSALKPEIIFWIAYPKKSSGIISDLEMTGNWRELEKYGFTTVASAAINKTWTALRFRQKDLVKKSSVSIEAIQNNGLNQYIDIKNRKVTLPEDIKQAVENEPTAFTAYQKLSYSHQKEYLISILTAKQEKTRESRIQKMIAKLIDR